MTDHKTEDPVSIKGVVAGLRTMARLGEEKLGIDRDTCVPTMAANLIESLQEELRKAREPEGELAPRVAQWLREKGYRVEEP